MQTFRRERRILKRPKHTAETKKTLRREKFLAKMLVQRRVHKIVTSILKFALGRSKKKRYKDRAGISEGKTLPVTAQPTENPISKSFPRIESAGQMLLFEPETPGPKCGQMSRGITVNMEAGIAKKNIFYIHYNTNSEEEFKQTINYNNPILLKTRFDIQKELIQPSNQQNEVIKPNIEPSLNELLKSCGSAFRFINKKNCDDSHFSFNFHKYGTMIMENAHRRYS